MPPPLARLAATGSQSTLRTYLRIFRWFALAVGIMLLYMLCQPATPPMVATNAEAGQRAETKIRRFQRALRDGKSRELQLTEVELNSWLKPQLDLAQPQPPDMPHQAGVSLPGPSASELPLSVEEIREFKATVTDVQLDLADDLLLAYLRFRLYGKDMSFELEGRLQVADGYLRLEPVAGKLGLLPIPSSTLKSAAGRIFDHPSQKEQFRLPDYIDSVWVENGELRIAHQGTR